MFFATYQQAAAYRRGQESDLPALRGRLAVKPDARTVWCRKTGEPSKESGFTVVIAK